MSKFYEHWGRFTFEYNSWGEYYKTLWYRFIYGLIGNIIGLAIVILIVYILAVVYGHS